MRFISKYHCSCSFVSCNFVSELDVMINIHWFYLFGFAIHTCRIKKKKFLHLGLD